MTIRKAKVIDVSPIGLVPKKKRKVKVKTKTGLSIGHLTMEEAFPDSAKRGLLKGDEKKTLNEMFPPLPHNSKPSNDIDNAVVTLSEKEYDRLMEIERTIKDLFTLALKVEGVVAFGRVKPDFKEPKIILKLRELTGSLRYEPPVIKTEKLKV
jgi:hypothetical protein